MLGREVEKYTPTTYDKIINSPISDGVDVINQTVNGESYNEDTDRSNALREFVESKARKFLAFFLQSFMTLRNDSIDPVTGEREGLGWTILKNLIWWPEKNMKTGWRVVQFIAMTLLLVTGIRPVYAVLQLALTPVMNLARFITEGVFSGLYMGFTLLQQKVKNRLNDHNSKTEPNSIQRRLWDLLDLFLDLPRGVFYVLGFISRAVLSPIEGTRQAREDWGLWGAIISGVTSFAAYAAAFTFAFPYIMAEGLPFVSGTVMPWLAAHTPAFLMTYLINPVIAPAANFLASTLGSAIVFLGETITAGISAIPLVGTAITAVASPLALGVGAAATLALTPAGFAAGKAYNAARFAIANNEDHNSFRISESTARKVHARFDENNLIDRHPNSIPASVDARIEAKAQTKAEARGLAEGVVHIDDRKRLVVHVIPEPREVPVLRQPEILEDGNLEEQEHQSPRRPGQ